MESSYHSTVALIFAEWADPADDMIIQRFIDTSRESLEREARENHILYPFIFLNDAGIKQDPISTYGYGASVEKLGAIAKKYDPRGVFQKQVPGFKISGESHAC